MKTLQTTTIPKKERLQSNKQKRFGIQQDTGCNMINRNASFRLSEISVPVDEMNIYNNTTERKVKEWGME
ncbi:MAG: hypothetical protein J6A03_12360 [Lachnospiraceae bacterium]|nr:hypothetical protein [Lachnospiraceae bacterium]